MPVPDGNSATGFNRIGGLAKWRLRRDQQANQRIHVVDIGDSLSEGFNATDRETQSWPALIRSGLQSYYSGSGAGIWNTKQLASATPPTGASFTIVGAWDQVQGQGPCGHSMTGQTTALTLSCTVNGTRGFICWNDLTGTYNGAFTYAIDGGSDVTITPAGTATLTAMITEFSLGAAGSHTILIKATATASRFTSIWGIGATGSTTGIAFHKFGINGTKTAEWGSVVTNRKEWWRAIDPALSIICLDANDYQAQTALATYQTELDAIIAAALAPGNGSVLLVGAGPVNSSLTISQQMYHNVNKLLAEKYTCAYVDLLANWQSWAFANSQGWISGDGLHPSDLGHLQVGMVVLPITMSEDGTAPQSLGPFQQRRG